MTARVFTWDWKEEPNWAGLAKAVADLSGGQVGMALANTESETYMLVVADYPITEKDATAIWRRDRE